MRDYEIVYIFDSALEESRINEKLERFHSLATGENGGEITAVDHWGKRQLAYPIEKKTNGYYVVSQFTTETALLPELERNLKLDDDLLRYLIVLHEGEPTAPMSIAVQADRKRDEDDEDEDEED
ncbi:MAG TPA: 30S ribosomal protein S6 [Longimicrobiales bacterium]|nr:30S ribosomal protein S6 [Longimicrobiales bacterium]